MELITQTGLERTSACLELDAEALHRIGVHGRGHHGSGWPSRKKPPVGPESGRVAAQTTLAAPASTGRPPGPPMSVATQPGQTASDQDVITAEFGGESCDCLR